MLAGGWIQELNALLDSHLPENAKPFDFIGYRELRAVLRGEMRMEDARNTIQQSTRQYAKRQMTWFRKESAVYWCEGFGDDPQVQAKALKHLGEFIP
jgi:tRNA dimethylallyltransferase